MVYSPKGVLEGWLDINRGGGRGRNRRRSEWTEAADQALMLTDSLAARLKERAKIDGGQQGHGGDHQPRSEAARRSRGPADQVRAGEAAEIADRVDRGDPRRGLAARQEIGRQCPEGRAGRHDAGDGDRQQRHDGDGVVVEVSGGGQADEADGAGQAT